MQMIWLIRRDVLVCTFSLDYDSKKTAAVARGLYSSLSGRYTIDKPASGRSCQHE